MSERSTRDPRDLAPAHIRELAPYVPGRPMPEVAREYGLERVVKLASNENPLGPSPRAIEALAREIGEIHRYPDGGAVDLRRALGAAIGIPAERVLLGNGSNELLTLLARVFLREGDEAVMSEGAFAIYALATLGSGARPVQVPMRGFAHDLDAIAGAVGPRTKMVFLGNPNNPTGTIYRRAEWERFLAAIPHDIVVVCDDAYAEYVDDPEYPDTLREFDRHPLLVVLRTFSKIHGLAGLRIGYGAAPAGVVDLIDRLRDPFNVSHLAQVAALAALEDDAHIERSRRVAQEGRRFLGRVARGLGLAVVESHANFVLIEVGDAGVVNESLLRAGIIVRPVAGYGFPHHLRVSVGLPEENTAFAQALAAIFGISGTKAAGLVQPPSDALERGAT